MNILCDDVRARLPLFLTADLPTAEADAIRAHLAGCAECAADRTELARVRQLLDAAPAPPVPSVDVAAIYREALATHARSARRWKRVAAVGSLIAAGLLFAAVLPKLEVKVGRHELVVRWGEPPTAVVPPVVPHAAPNPADAELHARMTRFETKVNTLQTLLLALADDIDASDEQHRRQKDDLLVVAKHLRSVEADAREQFRRAEETDTALYTLVADKAHP